MTTDIQERAERLADPLGSMPPADRERYVTRISQALFEAHKAGRAEMKEEANWQPIETAPKDGTRIDVWRRGERLTDVFWSDEEEWWSYMGDTYPIPLAASPAPTHWRPLPAPPAIRSIT